MILSLLQKTCLCNLNIKPSGNVDQEHAYSWSRTRKGGWAVALRRSLHEYI